MTDAHILPCEQVADVDRWVDSELSDAAKYDNRAPLDDSGVWSLHRLAAKMYAAGWDAGERAATERENAARRRERAR
jgi:hypothetical protein